jgi:serine/threonine protein kinase/tetratricopeptide (TPR) repeat protein
MPHESRDEESIFSQAVEMTSAEERDAFLAEACGDNYVLRQRVEALLRRSDETQGMLDSPPPGLKVDADPAPDMQIGPYKLLEQIGEGGMGVVYLAEQKEPVQRRVALKIIKPGMDTRHVIGRFEAERQALAMMDHPHIAKVYDAGTTESDRPYFVMELVEGVPITKYCDEQQLTLSQRLELFIPICQAVQHAHQKGIIHRDLKPSNILVAESDGRPLVIDFGVAKAIGQAVTEETSFTQDGQIVGTLEYMSPEQANLNQLDIDTRSDIYSLGVLLYELLVGATPFDRARLRSAAFEEMMRIIREEEPPIPSLRLSTMDSSPSVAANRHIEPRRLRSLVHGELDWIVMRALEKDRTRRYATASAFAEDVQRYLDNEPVKAGPPSRAYKFRKFVRRNRTVLTTVAVVALTLVTAAGIAMLQAIRVTQAKQQALAEREQKLAERERVARAEQVTQTRTRELDQLQEYSQRLFRQRNETQRFCLEDLLGEFSQNADLCSLLDRASTKISMRFRDDWGYARPIYFKLADCYLSLGELEKARLLFQQDREESKRADGQEWSPVLSQIANCYADHGYHEEAERLYLQAIDVSRQRFGPEHPNRLGAMLKLAEFYRRLGRYEDAETLYVEVDLIRDRKAGQSRNRVRIRSRADFYEEWGRYEKAEQLYKEYLNVSRQEAGEPTQAMLALAGFYFRQGRYELAEKVYREGVEITSRNLPNLPPDALSAYRDLLREYKRQSQEGDEVPQQQPMFDLSEEYANQGHFSDAHRTLADAVQIHEGKEGGQKLADERRKAAPHHSLPYFMINLGRVYTTQGRYGEAERTFRDLVSICQGIADLGPPFVMMTSGGTISSQWTKHPYDELAWFLATCPDPKFRNPAEAVALATKAVETRPVVFGFYDTLGVAQYRAGNWKAAIESLDTSINRHGGGDSVDFLFLAMAHWQLDEKEEARRWYDKAIEWIKQNPTEDEELKRFHAEAAELLGTIEEAKPQKPKQAPDEKEAPEPEASAEKPENDGEPETEQ